MSMTNTAETRIARLLFLNENAAGVGDATGLRSSTADGNWLVHLYTTDPGETGAGTETTYTGYAAVSVSRATGFTESNGVVSPAANIDFGECTASPGGAITHFALKDSAGTTWFYGEVTPNITMATGVIPRLKTTSTITFD